MKFFREVKSETNISRAVLPKIAESNLEPIELSPPTSTQADS